jgi:hypothetical protein
VQRLLIVALLWLAVVGAACGSQPRGGDVLYSGFKGRVISDNEASSHGRAMLSDWAHDTSGRQVSDLRKTVACKPPAGFLKRLRAAAAPFEVKAVVCYGMRRFAPAIVIESDQYVQLSRAIMGIAGNARGAGNRFPIFVEAVDSRGIPYSILMTWVSTSGGSVFPWARADALWPCARCHTV